MCIGDGMFWNTPYRVEYKFITVQMSVGKRSLHIMRLGAGRGHWSAGGRAMGSRRPIRDNMIYLSSVKCRETLCTYNIILTVSRHVGIGETERDCTIRESSAVFT